MKKTYMIPEMEVVNINFSHQLLTVSSLVLDGDISIDPTNADAPDLDGMFTTEDLDGFFGM